MALRQYKITQCNILQNDFQSSPHDLQCNVTHPLPPHTQHEVGGPDIRAQKGSSLVTARSTKNCMSLNIHHILQLEVPKMQWRSHVVFRTRKTQTHKSITMDELRLSEGNCILVEDYVVQSILICPQVFRLRNMFYPCPSVPEYVSVEQVENASTESVEHQLQFNIFVDFIMSPALGDGVIHITARS